MKKKKPISYSMCLLIRKWNVGDIENFNEFWLNDSIKVILFCVDFVLPLSWVHMCLIGWKLYIDHWRSGNGKGILLLPVATT